MLDEHTLQMAAANFLVQYPGGFTHPEMEKIGRKHRMEQMIAMAQEAFSRKACRDVDKTAENMVKLVSRSSMVSMFEKPKFRDFVKQLSDSERGFMVNALDRFLHGKAQAGGFEALVDLLDTGKLAKWSLVSIIPAYYRPQHEVFVKPTTAKGVLRFFDVPDLVYKPRPSWAFYDAYRSLINDAKTRVDPGLSPSNAAFSGFLMMACKA